MYSTAPLSRLQPPPGEISGTERLHTYPGQLKVPRNKGPYQEARGAFCKWSPGDSSGFLIGGIQGVDFGELRVENFGLRECQPSAGTLRPLAEEVAKLVMEHP